MRNVKESVIAAFFLVCFTGCIATNCIRNTTVLMQAAGKVQQKNYAALLQVKATPGAPVYFLMDKKENETQKYPCNHLFVPKSTFSHATHHVRYCEGVRKAGKSTPIYIVVHCYRI